MDELLKLLWESMNDRLYQMTAGGPRKRDGDFRVRIRPVLLQGSLFFQMERFCGNQVFHKNMSDREAVEIAAGGQTVYEGATNRPQGHVQALSINTNGSTEVWGWGVNMYGELGDRRGIKATKTENRETGI